MENKEMKKFDANDIVSESTDMKNYIDQLVNKLRNDKEVYDLIKPLNLSLREVKENIAKLSDYQDDFNYCKNCPGIKKCNKNTPHLAMYIYKDGNYLTTRYEPCSKIIDKIKLDSKYLYSDFPEEWKTSRIKTMDLNDEKRRAVISVFRDIVKKTSTRSVYLYGNHKVGKSFLLVTFANEFISLNLGQVAVIKSNTRFKELADSSFSDKDAFSKEMVALSNVPLLIIDDFGEEYVTEYVRDQIILPILNERCKNDRLTFFSSEFSINEIQKLYSIGKNGGEIRGKQLGNILRSMCVEEFDLTGASIYKK